MKYRTVLIFSEVFCTLIVFHFLDSLFSVLNGFDFYFSWGDSENRELIDETYTVQVKVSSSEKDGIIKVPLILYIFKTLRKSSNWISSVTQREHRHQRTLLLRYLLRLYSPSFHRTTRVILGWNGPISETNRIAEQAQVRRNYIPEPCTTCSRWSSGTELAGVECGCLSLWWQCWLECLSLSIVCHHSPSKTSRRRLWCHRTHNRTDVPALWPLIFPVGRKIFRTGCLWLQNILATYWLCARKLKVG